MSSVDGRPRDLCKRSNGLYLCLYKGYVQRLYKGQNRGTKKGTRKDGKMGRMEIKKWHI